MTEDGLYLVNTLMIIAPHIERYIVSINLFNTLGDQHLNPSLQTPEPIIRCLKKIAKETWTHRSLNQYITIINLTFLIRIGLSEL